MPLTVSQMLCLLLRYHTVWDSEFYKHCIPQIVDFLSYLVVSNIFSHLEQGHIVQEFLGWVLCENKAKYRGM